MKAILKLTIYLNKFIIKTINTITNNIVFYRENIVLKKSKINGCVFVINKGNIKIGANLKVNSGKKYNPIGGDTLFRLICKKNAEIIIGNNVKISNSTIFCTNKITIESNVMIGGSCKIWDTDFHALDKTIRESINDKANAVSHPIKIEKNVFIGSSTIILKGVVIGESSIIGAGSVVTKSIPKNQIWAGNPAKFIKVINE